MQSLNRKMLRDCWRMRGQLLAITLVVIAGVATYVGMRGVMNTLQHTQATYYAEHRFADGFASLRRAPERVGDQLREVPGINEVETRVQAGANLEVPDFDEPVAASIRSVPDRREARLNRLFIRDGRPVEPGRSNEVLLNEVFAEAHELEPGDEITATIRGRQQRLTVAGIALSPEAVLQVQPGALFPDPERFGVLWMSRSAVAAAYDMEGAFNNVTFSLAPDAALDNVLERVDRHLDRYGGRGAYGRDDQASHALLDVELQQLEGVSTLLPAIFLVVAAFLLNIVVARLVNLQREQIAMLKAFGYDDWTIGWHYVKLVLLVVAIGAAIGSALGLWIERAMGEIYLQFFRFPVLDHSFEPGVVLTAVLLTAGASLLGVIGAVRRAVRLPPAEAMRPPAPPTYQPTLVERIGLQGLFDQPTRMILRNLERQPIKSLLTMVGIAASCAILIMGLFFGDAFDYVVEAQFEVAQREDVTVMFTEPTSTKALHELASMEGVQHAEPFRSAPVRLHHEHRTQEIAVEGVPPKPYLRRVIDADLRPIPIPDEGIVLTERLAENLDVGPGDEIRAEVQEGARPERSVPVVGTAQEFIGMAAYMSLDAMHDLVGEGPALSGVFLLVDGDRQDELMNVLHDRPQVASVVSQDRVIQAFRETSAESLLVFTFVLSIFAAIIAFGVIYNSIRITLSERDRELASLRVLGFTRGEISYILLGEMAILTLLAIPIGFGVGALASAGIAASLQTDMFYIPLVLERDTFALAAAVVLGSAAASALIVRRRLNNLDLIGVLKTRE